MKKIPRDLLIFFAFSALPIAGFMLANFPNTQFDVSLLVVSLIVLLWFQQYYKETHQLLVYDENLHSMSLVYVVLGVIASLAIATYMTSAYLQQTVSSIYVPTTKMSLSIGSTILPAFWSDVLFTLTLVAPAEECSKLVSSLGFYVWLKDKIGNWLAKVIAIVVPIGMWALLHTYQNPAYQGQYMTVFVGTAFIAGLVIEYIMMKTKSLLAAILCHAAYNCVVLYIAYNPF